MTSTLAPLTAAGSRGWRIAGGFVAGLAVAGAIALLVRPGPTPLLDAQLALEVRPTLRGAAAAPADPPPDLPWIHDEIPRDRKGRPLDQRYPSLVGWIHPITGAAEKVPRNPARHFGAGRHRIERRDCGRGHCGIDLDGPRGRAIVAVAPGVVVRVERRRSGGDGISGRFVRIQHDDGYFTSYMHLDSVSPKLRVGDRVGREQVLGTLGSTGVAANAPHLHFSLELPRWPNKRWTSYKAMRFVDPVPFLVRAKIIPKPKRRRVHHAF